MVVHGVNDQLGHRGPLTSMCSAAG